MQAPSSVTPAFVLLALFNLFFSLLFRLSADKTLFNLMAVFGFAGFLLVGALYHVVPNAQGKELPYPRLAWLSFAFALLATLNLYTLDARGAASFVFLSFLVAGGQLLWNYRNFSSVTHRFLFAALLYLVLSGFFLAAAYNAGGLLPSLAVHTFTLGALLNAVYGVLSAWMPLLLAEAYEPKELERLFVAKQLATPVVLLGFLIGDYALLPFLFVAELACALYFLYLTVGLLERRKPLTPAPEVVKLFLTALFLLPVGMIMGAYAAGKAAAFPVLLSVHLDFVFYGFVAFTAFGGILHLLPRVVWSLVRNRPTKQSLKVEDLISEQEVKEFTRWAWTLYALFLALETLPGPLQALSSAVYLVLLVLFFRAITPTVKALL
ncbi:MAG: hypothetical protein GXO03_01945 [Aquificae bacterium]|nr:hypothetical protein [Aquificota bacterium]